MQGEKKREYLIDALRGAAVLSMVLFHFCYDVFMILGRDPGWYERGAVTLWQQSICWSFILISGYVWRWGKRRALRRGLLLNACGAVVSLVTWAARCCCSRRWIPCLISSRPPRASRSRRCSSCCCGMRRRAGSASARSGSGSRKRCTPVGC